MRRLIISAPFGNYIQPEGATPTLGTFTLHRRRGRWRRVLRTVRYYPRIGAWVNRIGLRNPGIDWLVERCARKKCDTRDKIVSIHGFDADEWEALIEKACGLSPLAIELNMSCPNVGEVEWPEWLFSRAVERAGEHAGVIVKLPPVNYELILEQALAAGVRRLHCCNTLPVPAGGVSGKPLKPVSLACIRRVRELAGDTRDELRIIGGGGITTTGDIDDYAEAGASHAAIGTKAMNPWLLISDRHLRPLVLHAERVLGARPEG